MSDKNLTDNEIIKALECCIKETSDCGNCPLYVPADADCINISKAGALDLINRQKAEIENLKYAIDAINNTTIAYIKAEAVKEFAERLKEKAHRPNPYPYIEIILKEDIDNIVKEMVGE